MVNTPVITAHGELNTGKVASREMFDHVFKRRGGGGGEGFAKMAIRPCKQCINHFRSD